MRPEPEVRHRFAQLKMRYLQRLFRKELRRRPANCQFNKAHMVNMNGQDVEVRLCMLGVDRPDWNVDTCETAKQATSCPAFMLVRNREQIEEQFENNIQEIDYLRENYRDLYTLSWVLGDVETKYTWWQRFWLFLETRSWRKHPPMIEEKDDAESEDE